MESELKVKRYKVRQRVTIEREISVMADCDEAAIENAPTYEIVLGSPPHWTSITGAWSVYDSEIDIAEEGE